MRIVQNWHQQSHIAITNVVVNKIRSINRALFAAPVTTQRAALKRGITKKKKNHNRRAAAVVNVL